MRHLRTLLPYYRPYLKGLAIGMALVVVSNVFTILGPHILRLAIDALTVKLSGETVLRYAVLLVAVAVASGVARYGMRELLNGISRRIETDLRTDIFAHLLRLPAAFYDRWRTGDLISRATNDVLAVRQVAGPAIMYLVNTATISAFALALMIWISPLLTGVAMLPMMLMPAAVLWFGRRIHTRFEQIQSQFSTISNFAQENLAGIRIVKAYVREADRSRRFARLNEEYRERNMELARIWGAFFPTLMFLGGLGSVVVLWVGGQLVMGGSITLGEFVAFGFYLTLLMWPMIAIGWVTNLFQRGAASMARINALLREPVTIRDPERPADLRRPRGEIEFDGVSFRYPGTERWVLRDVSLHVRPGQKAAIVGGTATGKTTLVRLIPRLYDVSEGAVRLDGIDVRELRLAELRAAVSVVPQDAFLFSASLRENLALAAAGSEDEVNLARVVDVAQLRPTLDVLPDGLDTRLGERGINLSGGQKQRATIARALNRDAAVFILDDALSAVDATTEEAILAGLDECLRGRTTLIVSHRVSAVAGADVIFVLEDGRLVETGRHEDLLAQAGVYARLLERQLLETEIERDLAG